MRFHLQATALGVLVLLVMPSIARSQTPAPVAPAQLLAQRNELRLTPGQVRELTLLSAQVRRLERALLLAPSKPWMAESRGRSGNEASRRALALLSADQREVAVRLGRTGQ